MHFSSIHDVVNEWMQRGGELQPAASREEIERTFAELGMAVSSDVIELYQLADGYERHYYDDNHWYWWPLDYIREMAPHNPTGFVCFADWLIDSYYFALKYEDARTSSVYYHSPPFRNDDSSTYKLADSLTEFLHFAIRDPERVEIHPLGD